MQQQIQLHSDKALYRMSIEEIETYKLQLALAIADAPTELERDPLRNKIDGANRILNNKRRSWR